MGIRSSKSKLDTRLRRGNETSDVGVTGTNLNQRFSFSIEKPANITDAKHVTFTMTASENSHVFISWGTSSDHLTTEVIRPNGTKIEKEYVNVNENSVKITITGDLTKITSFSINDKNSNVKITSFNNLEVLTSLTSFILENQNIQKVLTFNNDNLKILNLYNSYFTSNLIINTTNLKTIYIENSTITTIQSNSELVKLYKLDLHKCNNIVNLNTLISHLKVPNLIYCDVSDNKLENIHDFIIDNKLNNLQLLNIKDNLLTNANFINLLNKLMNENIGKTTTFSKFIYNNDVVFEWQNQNLVSKQWKAMGGIVPNPIYTKYITLGTHSAYSANIKMTFSKNSEVYIATDTPGIYTTHIFNTNIQKEISINITKSIKVYSNDFDNLTSFKIENDYNITSIGKSYNISTFPELSTFILKNNKISNINFLNQTFDDHVLDVLDISSNELNTIGKLKIECKIPNINLSNNDNINDIISLQENVNYTNVNLTGINKYTADFIYTHWFELLHNCSNSNVFHFTKVYFDMERTCQSIVAASTIVNFWEGIDKWTAIDIESSDNFNLIISAHSLIHTYDILYYNSSNTTLEHSTNNVYTGDTSFNITRGTNIYIKSSVVDELQKIKCNNAAVTKIEFDNFIQITELDFNGTKISNINISNITDKLIKLNVANTDISELPEKLDYITHLNISNTDINTDFELNAENLIDFNCSNNIIYTKDFFLTSTIGDTLKPEFAGTLTCDDLYYEYSILINGTVLSDKISYQPIDLDDFKMIEFNCSDTISLSVSNIESLIFVKYNDVWQDYKLDSLPANLSGDNTKLYIAEDGISDINSISINSTYCSYIDILNLIHLTDININNTTINELKLNTDNIKNIDLSNNGNLSGTFDFESNTVIESINMSNTLVLAVNLPNNSTSLNVLNVCNNNTLKTVNNLKALASINEIYLPKDDGCEFRLEIDIAEKFGSIIKSCILEELETYHIIRNNPTSKNIELEVNDETFMIHNNTISKFVNTSDFDTTANEILITKPKNIIKLKFNNAEIEQINFKIFNNIKIDNDIFSIPEGIYDFNMENNLEDLEINNNKLISINFDINDDNALEFGGNKTTSPNIINFENFQKLTSIKFNNNITTNSNINLKYKAEDGTIVTETIEINSCRIKLPNIDMNYIDFGFTALPLISNACANNKITSIIYPEVTSGIETINLINIPFNINNILEFISKYNTYVKALSKIPFNSDNSNNININITNIPETLFESTLNENFNFVDTAHWNFTNASYNTTLVHAFKITIPKNTTAEFKAWEYNLNYDNTSSLLSKDNPYHVDSILSKMTSKNDITHKIKPENINAQDTNDFEYDQYCTLKQYTEGTNLIKNYGNSNIQFTYIDWRDEIDNPDTVSEFTLVGGHKFLPNHTYLDEDPGKERNISFYSDTDLSMIKCITLQNSYILPSEIDIPLLEYEIAFQTPGENNDLLIFEPAFGEYHEELTGTEAINCNKTLESGGTHAIKDIALLNYKNYIEFNEIHSNMIECDFRGSIYITELFLYLLLRHMLQISDPTGVARRGKKRFIKFGCYEKVGDDIVPTEFNLKIPGHQLTVYACNGSNEGSGTSFKTDSNTNILVNREHFDPAVSLIDNYEMTFDLPRVEVSTSQSVGITTTAGKCIAIYNDNTNIIANKYKDIPNINNSVYIGNAFEVILINDKNNIDNLKTIKDSLQDRKLSISGTVTDGNLNVNNCRFFGGIHTDNAANMVTSVNVWDEYTTYNAGQLVRYNGIYYICINSTSTIPTSNDWYTGSIGSN